MAKNDNLTDFLTDVADGIRTVEGTTAAVNPQDFRDRIEGIVTTVTSDANATADNILNGKTAYVNGVKVTGNIATKTSSDLTVSSNTVTVTAGYYATSASKSVSTATQATPTIMVSTSSGLITASSTQSDGYVSGGTKTATKQLSTKAATTITPGTSAQTAVAKGYYTTGAVTVAGDANLIASNIKKDVSIFGVTGTYEGGSTGNTWYQHTISFSSSMYSGSEVDNSTEIYDGSIVLVNNSSSEIQSLSSLLTALENYGATSSSSGITCGGYGGNPYNDQYGWILKTWAQSYSIYFYIHVRGTSTYTTESVASDSDYEDSYTTVTDTVKTLGVVSPTMALSTDSDGKTVLTITDNL